MGRSRVGPNFDTSKIALFRSLESPRHGWISDFSVPIAIGTHDIASEHTARRPPWLKSTYDFGKWPLTA